MAAYIRLKVNAIGTVSQYCLSLSSVLAIRSHSTVTMGQISGKCDRKSRFKCACCENSLSNCTCNCEKSSRCLCAGPRNFHRIGNYQNRWFSTSKKINNRDLTGTTLLREPNVNKVCLKHMSFQ